MDARALAAPARAPAPDPAPPAPAVLLAALDSVAEAVLLCSAADHSIVLVNAAASALLPDLEPGHTTTDCPLAGLARATADGATVFTDEHRGRRLLGCRRPLGPGHYGWFVRDTTEEVAWAEAAQAERARTQFLAEAGRRLSVSLHRRRCLRTTVELAVAHLADAAVVVLPPRRGQSEWLRMVSGGPAREDKLREIVLGEVPGLTEVLGGFPPVPSRWLDPARLPAWLLPEGPDPVGALLLTPLPGNAEPAGALILARRGGAVFTAEDELLVRIFATRAGSAISAAARHREQLDTAAILQADLLPPELPRPAGIELAGSCRSTPGAPRTGGDFYDVFGPADSASRPADSAPRPAGGAPAPLVAASPVRPAASPAPLVAASSARPTAASSVPPTAVSSARPTVASPAVPVAERRRSWRWVTSMPGAPRPPC